MRNPVSKNKNQKKRKKEKKRKKKKKKKRKAKRTLSLNEVFKFFMQVPKLFQKALVLFYSKSTTSCKLQF